LQRQQLITVLGVNGEFASGIPSNPTPKAQPICFISALQLFIYQATLMRRGAWMKSGFGFMIRDQEVVQCE